MTQRWTDDRLDDMAELVHRNTRTLDQRTVRLDRLEQEAAARRSARDSRRRHEWAVYMLLLSILATELAHLIS